MSQSIQAAPQAASSSSTQSTKTVLVTNLITAATTIAVAFVGIFPHVIGKNKEQSDQQIAQVRQENEFLKAKLTAPAAPADAAIPPGKKKTIEGTVLSEDGKRRMSNVDVFLMPVDGPRLVSQTDANGRFILPDIPSGVYSIIVLADGRGAKTYLVENEEEVKVPGTLIKYRIRDKGDD